MGLKWKAGQGFREHRYWSSYTSGGQLKELISRSNRTPVSDPGRVCIFILSKWRLKALWKGVMLVM